MILVAQALAVLVAAAAVFQNGIAKSGNPSGFPAERQILWQRSLEDAQAISAAEGRPILLAVNMDGESASERIVRERYRDPAFVALTRPFVCVVGSAFRHAPRDHDERGRRIACPRLGEITCGEHIALEPAMFDRYLGGERIAPRHALILPDGTKRFDLFLLFDLGEVDKELAESKALAPPPAAIAESATTNVFELARSKDHDGRARLERVLSLPWDSERWPEKVLAAIATEGDAGSVEALRLLLHREPPSSAILLDRIGATAQALRIEPAVAAVVREKIASLGRFPGAPGLGEDERLLTLLGRLDRESAASRSLLLAYALLGAASESARAADALGGRLRLPSEREEILAWWSRARESSDAPPPPRMSTTATADELPAAEALEGELSDLDRELEGRPEDPELLARYGKTTLALARRRMESGGSGAQLLLQDADRFLARATEAGLRDAALLLARARAAFLLGRFEEQERIAGEAVAAVRSEDERIEALRWLGDASARLLAARSGGDLAAETAGILRGARTLTTVAASVEAGETDWVSLASFLGALGMRREELAVLQAGVERLPASAVLRNAMNGALRAGGRIDLAPAKADWIAARHPDSPECAWWAGWARMLAAEDSRRAEDPERAIEEYRRAERGFAECARLRPDFQESSQRYLALCALGRGFAHLLAERRAEAASALAEGIATRPAVASERDGLDREAVDLLDGALEWRAEGESPVVVGELLDALERADPGNAFWARSICDSELREALRADGRGETAEGDAYLAASIDAGRGAVALEDAEETRRALAQALTVAAERQLARGEAAQAKEHLAEAAPLLGEAAPGEAADEAALKDLARKLRGALGAARPRFRPGR